MLRFFAVPTCKSQGSLNYSGLSTSELERVPFCTGGVHLSAYWPSVLPQRLRLPEPPLVLERIAVLFLESLQYDNPALSTYCKCG